MSSTENPPTTNAPKGDAPKPGEAKATTAPDAGTPANGDAQIPKPSPVAAIKAKLTGLLASVKSAKKGVGSPVASVKLGLKGLFKGVFEIPLLIIKGDFLTRILAIGFLASLVLVVVSGGKLWRRFGPAIEIEARKAQTESGDSATAYFQMQRELSIASDRLAFLERFTGTLRPSTFSKTARRKIPSFFEIELWAECDEPDTARWVKSRIPAAKEAVASVLQSRQYDRLLTEDGKTELQTEIVRALNSLLAKANAPGKVKKVYFSRFMMQ